MMGHSGNRKVRHATHGAIRCLGRIFVLGCAPGLLGACVSVSAPERPIEINLNINIRQEVVVSLREDARDLIQQNPGVF